MAFLVCVTIAAGAQTGTGTIQGTIKDPDGAVMPHAKVSITHTQTGREYNTTSNGAGFYLSPPVQAGPYRITVEAAGMEIWKGELTLQVGQVAEVDPALKIRGVANEITVAGDVTPLVTTTNPTLANVVERARIEQLPVNGRLIQSLLYLTTPGFEPGSVPRLFGLRYAVEILQDGAVLENRQWQLIPARPPGLDTIEEFRAETSNSSAKMNRPGTVILKTRAGTNEFHGAIFETHRNSAIGVARARQDFYDKPPHLVRNEFGASLGGPVFIPRLYSGKNQTFFFVSYEGLRLRSAATRAVTMPTAAMREGDFSGLIDGQGRRITLYDPLTTDAAWKRQPFPNNQIPKNRRSPLATYLYSNTPLPTHPEVNPLVAANWFGLGFNRQNQTTITTRIDHRLSERDQIFFRYSHNPSYQKQTTSPISNSPTTLDGRANARLDIWDNDSGVATWTHTFSPTFFSETLVAVSRDSRQILP
ncbi:MAG: carboxypeptidase-like regulatory domain-containing protein, partial [Acidobacteriales bacterium]|nr:carboxypeptidase-like regulatory domain-containing protein [Terriglobales bacterium]